MDELNPTVREQEIYEEMELTPEMIKSIPVSYTHLRYWESWTDYLTTASRLYKYSFADQLAEAVQHIEGNYTAVEIAAPDVADVEAQRKTLPADPTVKNFSYTAVSYTHLDVYKRQTLNPVNIRVE